MSKNELTDGEIGFERDLREVGELTDCFFCFVLFVSQDCNRDGVTNCDDYARTHFSGRGDCSSIEKTNFWKRYETCRPSSSKGEVDQIIHLLIIRFYNMCRTGCRVAVG